MGLLVYLCTLLVSAANVSAQTIVVDTLADVADPPFDSNPPCGTGAITELPGADGKISLREAIVAANNTAGAQRIELDASLRGGTLTVDFDDSDEDVDPEPLPILCGGDTTIDGDADGDETPDFELVGDPRLPPFGSALILFSSRNTVTGLRVVGFPVGIGVVHIAAFSFEGAFVGNTLADNVIEGGASGIFVQGGDFGDPTLSGVVRDTIVSGNQVSGTTVNGIIVLTTDAPGNEVSGTRITRNRVFANGNFGIVVQAGLTAAGASSLIDTTRVTENEVTGSVSTGITSFAVFGSMHTVQGLTIEDNTVTGNGFGIVVNAGVCGGHDNRLDAVLAGNVVTAGLIAGGGSNAGCPGQTEPARANRSEVRVIGNRVSEPSGNGLVVVGGSFGGNENEITAEVDGNQVVALTGIAITGGNGGSLGAGLRADQNTVTANLRRNAVGNSGAGIVLTAGASGEASGNHIEAIVEENAACKSFLADVQCYGGLPALPGFSPNLGSDNTVQVRVAGNEATVIASQGGTANNTCAAEVVDNTPCRDGDVNCDRFITAADLVSTARLTGLGETSPCALDAEIPAIATAIFDG